MIKSDLIIKRVTRGQLEALTYISRKTFTDAFTHLNNPDDQAAYLSDHLTNHSLATELNNANSEFYFVMEHAVPIAYFKLNTGDAQTELREDEGLEIERIYVLKDHQGKKLGHRLIEKIIEMAREKGKTYIWLGAWDKNTDALRFYKNNGFSVFDQHDFKIGSDIQTDLMLKLEIAGN